MTIDEVLRNALLGKRVKIMTDMKVEVELTITDIKQVSHTRDIGPSNGGNDWWPDQETWYTYLVSFDNGVVKDYSNLESIKLA